MKVGFFQDEDYFYRLDTDIVDGEYIYAHIVDVSNETAARWIATEKAFWDMQEELIQLRKLRESIK